MHLFITNIGRKTNLASWTKEVADAGITTALIQCLWANNNGTVKLSNHEPERVADIMNAFIDANVEPCLWFFGKPRMTESQLKNRVESILKIYGPITELCFDAEEHYKNAHKKLLEHVAWTAELCTDHASYMSITTYDSLRFDLVLPEDWGTGFSDSQIIRPQYYTITGDRMGQGVHRWKMSQPYSFIEPVLPLFTVQSHAGKRQTQAGIHLDGQMQIALDYCGCAPEHLALWSHKFLLRNGAAYEHNREAIQKWLWK